jgi:hypothetical protein
MQKIVELKIEEAKAVVGGARYAAASVTAGASTIPVVTTSISAQRR